MDTFSHLSSPPTDQAGHISSLKRPVASAFNNESQVLTNGQRPAKKRRKAEQKPRSTERLDLTNEDAADETQLNRLLDVLRTKRKIVVIAGAGISVSAGIPDFRSSKGLFEEYKSKTLGSGAALFDVSVYNSNNSTKQFHAMVCDLSVRAKEAEPTAFHNMLATIAHEGRLQRLYSQNIDCLETSLLPLATKTPLPAKKPWPTTIQVHGGLEKMHCMKCKFVSNFDASLFQGSEAPLCNLCKEQDDIRTGVYGKRSHGIGRLRPRIHLYNESSPDEDAIGAVSQADLRQVPDAVLVVGTSLVVPGIRRIAQQLCRATRSTRDGFTAWINPDPEPRGCDLKDVWDMVVCGRSDTIASLLGLPHWDCIDPYRSQSSIIDAELDGKNDASFYYTDARFMLEDDYNSVGDSISTPQRLLATSPSLSSIPQLQSTKSASAPSTSRDNTPGLSSNLENGQRQQMTLPNKNLLSSSSCLFPLVKPGLSKFQLSRSLISTTQFDPMPSSELLARRPLYFDVDEVSMPSNAAITLFKHYFPGVTFHPHLRDSGRSSSNTNMIRGFHWVYTTLHLYDVEGILLRREQFSDRQVLALVRWQLLDFGAQVWTPNWFINVENRTVPTLRPRPEYGPDTQYVALPCLYKGHWIAIVYDYQHNCIVVLDSLFAKQDQVVLFTKELIKRHLTAMKRFPDNFPQLRWVRTQQQKDKWSCGLHMVHNLRSFLCKVLIADRGHFMDSYLSAEGDWADYASQTSIEEGFLRAIRSELGNAHQPLRNPEIPQQSLEDWREDNASHRLKDTVVADRALEEMADSVEISDIFLPKPTSPCQPSEILLLPKHKAISESSSESDVISKKVGKPSGVTARDPNAPKCHPASNSQVTRLTTKIDALGNMTDNDENYGCHQNETPKDFPTATPSPTGQLEQGSQESLPKMLDILNEDLERLATSVIEDVHSYAATTGSRRQPRQSQALQQHIFTRLRDFTAEVLRNYKRVAEHQSTAVLSASKSEGRGSLSRLQNSGSATTVQSPSTAPLTTEFVSRAVKDGLSRES